jgi:hypothetical protein
MAERTDPLARSREGAVALATAGMKDTVRIHAASIFVVSKFQPLHPTPSGKP